MSTWQVQSPDKFRGNANVMYAIAAVPALIGGLAVVAAPGVGTGLVATLLFLVALGLFRIGRAQLREVCLIRVEAAGTVEFVGVKRATTVRARDIRILEARHDRGYDDVITWSLQVHHAGGRIGCGQFPGVLDFVGWVRALNPRVEVRGEWPMDASPPRQERAGLR
jgi:hypothetical protein